MSSQWPGVKEGQNKKRNEIMNSSNIYQTNLIHRWCELHAFVAIALVLACFALSPQARALPPLKPTGEQPKPKPSLTRAGCPPGSTCKDQSIPSGGLTRTYILHVSSKYDGSTAVPLVIVLHGYGSTA